MDWTEVVMDVAVGCLVVTSNKSVTFPRRDLLAHVASSGECNYLTRYKALLVFVPIYKDIHALVQDFQVAVKEKSVSITG